MSYEVEIETGTYRARRTHPHNGYYAGDFSDRPVQPMAFPRSTAPAPYLSGFERVTAES